MRYKWTWASKSISFKRNIEVFFLPMTYLGTSNSRNIHLFDQNILLHFFFLPRLPCKCLKYSFLSIHFWGKWDFKQAGTPLMTELHIQEKLILFYFILRKYIKSKMSQFHHGSWTFENWSLPLGFRLSYKSQQSHVLQES